MRYLFVLILCACSCIIGGYASYHYYRTSLTLDTLQRASTELIRLDSDMRANADTLEKESLQKVLQKVFKSEQLTTRIQTTHHTTFKQLPVIVRGVEEKVPHTISLWVDPVAIDPNYSTTSPYSMRYVNTLPALYTLILDHTTQFFICTETKLPENDRDMLLAQFKVTPPTWRELTKTDLAITNEEEFITTIGNDLTTSITNMVADHPLVVFVDTNQNHIEALYEDCRNGESL